MLVVRVDEPMRVAPGGHVIDLKLGETADGSLAEYLVATGCNVTVLSEPEPEVEPEVDGGNDAEQDGDGDLSASLTATADVLHEVVAGPEAEPEVAEPAPAKPAKTSKAAAK
jgi:hypothetical protein